ncbi:MAG: Mur ligase family protein [Hyphomonadaceae bacterium]
MGPANADEPLAVFEKLFGPEFGHGKALDLAALRAALDGLGNPQEWLPPFIHVAGTNGKGSTIAFMRAIAEAAGFSVHAFTKPHLFRLNERFVIASETAADDALIAAAQRVAGANAAITQFDAQVAAAFLLFNQAPADLVLLETGMGGRSDSTNVVMPALSVLTPIGLDHQDTLGATLADIASHKAGILKPGTPAVVARQVPEATRIIEDEAARVGAPLLRQGVEWDAFEQAGRFTVQTETRVLDLAPPALYGAHQIENAGLACAALLTLYETLSDDAFAAGVSKAAWPARLQPLTRGGFSAPVRARGGEVWVDGGHNQDAARALVRALGAMHRKRGGGAAAIVGLRARKDAAAFIAALAPALSTVIAVPLGEAHVEADEVAAFAHRNSVDARTAPSLAVAMQAAAQLPVQRVLICGSFLLAAEALAAEEA